MDTLSKELLLASENNVLIEFAKRFNIAPELIILPNKASEISELRQLYCKLRHENHGLNLAATGREINRKHSTVRYAVKRINELLQTKDPRTEALWKRVEDIPGFYM